MLRPLCNHHRASKEDKGNSSCWFLIWLYALLAVFLILSGHTVSLVLHLVTLPEAMPFLPRQHNQRSSHETGTFTVDHRSLSHKIGCMYHESL
jgi:hypothetical protein